MNKILIIAFGLLFAGIGVFMLMSGNAKAKRCTIETVGTVVEIKEERSTDSDGDNQYIYYPVIRYKAGERTITKQSSSGSSSNSKLSIGSVSFSSSHSKYSVNDSIDILYNPEKVEEFIIKGDKDTNFIGIAFLVLGSFVAIVGIIKPID